MRTDPYAELLTLMRSESDTGGVRLMLGTVKRAEPLLVDVGGTDQEAGRFYLCGRLARGSSETAALTGGTGGFTTGGGERGVSMDPGSFSLTGAALSRTEPVLKAGDTVLLLTENRQTFFLIDKVVHL